MRVILPGVINFLRKAAELNSNESIVFYALGIAYQYDEKIEKAIGALKQAVEIDPEFALAYNSLGLTYKEFMGDPKMAIKFYSKAAEVHLNSITKTVSESVQSSEVGILKSGEKTRHLNPYYFERVHKLLKSTPDYSFIKNNMGYCLLLLGDKDSAREAFEDSIDCIPDGMDYPPPYDGLKDC